MTLDEIQDKVLTKEYNYTLHAEAVTMEEKKCNFCGSPECGKRRMDYPYLYRGNYLLVLNTPVEVCLNCGMIYFDAKVLKVIEKRFFAIQRKSEKPDGYVELPVAAYAESIGYGA